MKKTLISTIAAMSPLLALAQVPDIAYITNSGTDILSLINNFLVPLIIALAVLVFLWGVFKAFILGGTDEGKRAEGRKLMLWGIIAFVVMVALWGVVSLVTDLFGLGGTNEAIPAPSATPQAPGSTI